MQDPENTGYKLIKKAAYQDWIVAQFDGGNDKPIRVFKYVGNGNNKKELREIAKSIGYPNADSLTTTIPNTQSIGDELIEKIRKTYE
jgi:hypothetical protein